MDKISQEIEQMAEKLDKANQDPKEKLFTIIKALGKDGLKARLATLSDEDKVVLKAALEELSLKKAISFDKEINSVHHVQGNIMDTKIQEDKADDDVDETLVKPEAAHMDHQGTPTDGWQGQVIKGKEGQMKSSEVIAEIKKSDELTFQFIYKALDHSNDPEAVLAKCLELGFEKAKVMGAMSEYVKDKKVMGKVKKSKMKEKLMKDEEGQKPEKQPKDGVKEMKQAKPEKPSSMPPEMKKAGTPSTEQKEEENPEAKKQDGDVAKLEGGRKLEKRPENLEVAEASADAQKDVDKMNVAKALDKDKSKEESKERDDAPTDADPKKVDGKDDKRKEKVKKSVSWEGEDRLLKANRQGRNFNFNLEGFVSETLKKAEEKPTDEIKKSEKVDLNDLIEKSQDRNWDQLQHAREMEANAKASNGRLVKSFNETDVASILGLSEEEAKKILG